jgi:hypothetical protein
MVNTASFEIYLKDDYTFNDITTAITDSFGKEFKWVNQTKAQKTFKQMDLEGDENVFIGTILLGKIKTPIKIYVLEYDELEEQDDLEDLKDEEQE